MEHPLELHRGKLDSANRMARPIQIPWTCSQTGDCCRSVKEIAVSAQEKALLDRPDISLGARSPLLWTDLGNGFWSLKGAPCPFLSDQGTCTVYSLRPYNCRRFICGRVNVQLESYEQGGPIGCYNLSDRIDTSLRFQHYLRGHEARAFKEWGQEHGWDPKRKLPVKVDVHGRLNQGQTEHLPTPAGPDVTSVQRPEPGA